MNYLIALGSNLHKDKESPADLVSHALWHFEGQGLRIVAQSKFYRTPAFPPGRGPDFVNAVAEVQSSRAPGDVLETLHRIEAALGRERRDRWEARIIDLDILACGDGVLPDEMTARRWIGLDGDAVETAAPRDLVLPHPRLHERAFVLVPLADVAPRWKHPVLGKTVTELLSEVPAADLDSIIPLEDTPPRQDVAE